jgi:hypothetical protein
VFRLRGRKPGTLWVVSVSSTLSSVSESPAMAPTGLEPISQPYESRDRGLHGAEREMKDSNPRLRVWKPLGRHDLFPE